MKWLEELFKIKAVSLTSGWIVVSPITIICSLKKRVYLEISISLYTINYSCCGPHNNSCAPSRMNRHALFNVNRYINGNIDTKNDIGLVQKTYLTGSVSSCCERNMVERMFI